MKITPKIILTRTLFVVFWPIVALLFASTFITIIYELFGVNSFSKGSSISILGLGFVIGGYLTVFTKHKIHKLKAFSLLMSPSLVLSFVGTIVPSYGFLIPLSFCGPIIMWPTLKYWIYAQK